MNKVNDAFAIVHRLRMTKSMPNSSRPGADVFRGCTCASRRGEVVVASLVDADSVVSEQIFLAVSALKPPRPKKGAAFVEILREVRNCIEFTTAPKSARATSPNGICTIALGVESWIAIETE